MSADCVLGVDSSTTAAKVVAWNGRGENLGEGRCAIALASPARGRYEQDPCDWWRALVAAVADLGTRFDLNRVAALSISNQRETVAFLSAAGEPVAPAIVWLDERCRSEVDSFAARIGADEIHRITGKHKDLTPVVYRLAWMRAHAPQICRQVEMISDVQGFLVHRLTGAFRTSWASADPMGCWEIVGKKWSAQILAALDWDDSFFPVALAPGASLGFLTAQAAAQTGLPTGTEIIAGGGDGQCAGFAVGASRPGAAYVNIGTAAVCGAHQREYAYGRAWRTMTSMSGEGYIMESCLRSGTFLLNWLVRDIFGLAGDAEDFAALEQEAAALPPGAAGLRVSPYWSGVMNPHWDPDARGAIFGLTGGHGRAHLYRAAIEAIALDQAHCLRAIGRETGAPAKRYYAVGGGARSDLWCQIFADCLDAPILRLDTIEASALGAGMSAAAGAGLHDSIAAAATAMRGKTQAEFAPGENAPAYAEMLPAYEKLYPASRAALAQ